MSIVFVLLYFFYWLIEQSCFKKYRRIFLFASCAVLTFIVGFRSFQWPDTAVYAQSFLFYTNDLFNYSISDVGDGYSDKGFYFLSSVIKTFVSDYTIYFLIISTLTFFFIYKSLRYYCIYPLIGLCIYVARFMLSRNMMQIRAALAIAIVIYALQYVGKRDFKRYLLFVILGTTLHMSLLLALPLYWLDKIKITSNIILYCIVGAFLCVLMFSSLIIDKLSEVSMLYNIAQTYTLENSGYTAGLGLYNPMLYYQTFILLMFTYNEKKLFGIVPYYITIRNGYFYSTTLLIILSPFLVLAGRTSTIFATCEMFIIPSLILVLPIRYRSVGFFGVGVIASAFFYLNYSSASANF